MSDYYMVIGYDSGTFDENVSGFKENGINPVEMDNLSLAYQYIFFNLNNPEEFLNKNPEYLGEKVLAIKLSEKHFPRGRIVNTKHESGLSLRLIQMLDKDDLLDVSDAEFFNLNTFKLN